MTNRQALHAMLVYAHREAEEGKMGSVAQFLTLAMAEIEREGLTSKTDIRSGADSGQHPLHSRLQ